jgi:hypothetical protein
VPDSTSAQEFGITPAMRTADLSLITSSIGRTGSLTVHVHVYWATRRIQSKDTKGVRSFYSGYAREVFLVRRGRTWSYQKTGEMLIG